MDDLTMFDLDSENKGVILQLPHIAVYHRHLEISDLEYNEGLTRLRTAHELIKVMPLWYGDLVIAMADELIRTGEVNSKDEAYERIAYDLGESSPAYVIERASVSRRIPHMNRIYDVSYSVYSVCASLPTEGEKGNEQGEWLQKAQDNRTGANTLRSQIDAIKNPNKMLEFKYPNSSPASSNVSDNSNWVNSDDPQTVKETQKVNDELKQQIEDLTIELDNLTAINSQKVDLVDDISYKYAVTEEKLRTAQDKLESLREIMESMSIENFSPEFIKELWREEIIDEEVYEKLMNKMKVFQWSD